MALRLARALAPAGDPDGSLVEVACANARLASRLCDLLERGPAQLPLEAARLPGVDLWELIEDPDERPYIWDLED